MQLTLTNILLLLAPLTTALPTSPLSQRDSNTNTNPLLTPRACPRVFPASTPRLNLLNYPNIPVTTTQTLTFTLPASAPGPCTLRARFPPRWEVFDSSLLPTNPPTGPVPGLPVNVFAVDGPAAGALVGTVRFASAEPGAALKERIVTINSFACRERMTFRFELAGVGEVGFVNGEDGAGGEGGVEVVWGC